MKGKPAWILLLLPVLAGIISCSAKMPPQNAEGTLALDSMVQNTIDTLMTEIPDLESKIQDSLAYAVFDWKLTKVPVFGAGSGEGVLSVTDTGEKIYFDASRFDIGGGIGKRSYRTLMIIDSAQILDRARDGTWIFLAGTEAAGIGSNDSRITTTSDEGYTLYVLHGTGTLVSVTARIIRMRQKW